MTAADEADEVDRVDRADGGGENDAAEEVDEVVDSAPVRLGARVGIGAYGVTHLVVAVLAIQLAFGNTSERTDQSGAFEALAHQPLGLVLLWVLVIGFAAATLWRVYEAVRGFSWVQERRATLMRRAQTGGQAIVSGTLAVLGVTTLVGGSGGGTEKATAGVLGLPGGQVLVALVGVGTAVVGGWTVWSGWTRRFMENLALPPSLRVHRFADRTGLIGFVAKGLTLVLVGVLIVVAAIRFDPQQANGLDAALKGLAGQPYGPYLLVALALGLIAYGVYGIVDARYHRIS
ncbi:DUF1206 domain-containing protein [Pseudonocardia sp. CA-107938]|uniref:DUF1206 domain-containing protein n=1 Tax=Pseudonocardia sp. CA-107938 TaxID=3240021 RepID=UPI003D8EC94B